MFLANQERRSLFQISAPWKIAYANGIVRQDCHKVQRSERSGSPIGKGSYLSFSDF